MQHRVLLLPLIMAGVLAQARPDPAPRPAYAEPGIAGCATASG
jgi:hypothetical protein